MNYKEAKKNVLEFVRKLNDDFRYQEHVHTNFNDYVDHDKDDSYLKFKVYVDRGGMHGGNCWGDDAENYSGSNISLNGFIIFDLFENIAPEINFIPARIIARDCVTSTTSTDYEYYGNYSTTEKFSFDFEFVLDELIKLGFIK